MPWLLLGHAETRLNSSTAGLLIAVVPLFAAIIVTKLGHEKLEPRRLFGLGLGFAGVALLVGLDIHFADLPAVAATIVVALCYAIGPIIIDRKLNDVPAIGVITASLIVATIIYAPFAPFLWPETFSAPAVASVIGLGVLCTAAAFIVFFALIAEVGPARATVITYVNPAVAILLGALVLHEPLTIGMAIGFPLVIAGSFLGTMRKQACRARLPLQRAEDWLWRVFAEPLLQVHAIFEAPVHLLCDVELVVAVLAVEIPRRLNSPAVHSTRMRFAPAARATSSSQRRMALPTPRRCCARRTANNNRCASSLA